jgi:antitoxin CcdA
MEQTRGDTRKQTINLSIQKAIINQAKELELNISRNAEKGIKEAIKQERSKRWKQENKAAIHAHNKRVNKQGLLIETYWMEQ